MNMVESLLGDSREAQELKRRFLDMAVVNTRDDNSIVLGRASGLKKNASSSLFDRNRLPPVLYQNNLAKHGTAEANSQPIKAVRRIIARERPYIKEIMKPSPDVVNSSRWAPIHASKTVSVEDVVRQQKSRNLTKA